MCIRDREPLVNGEAVVLSDGDVEVDAQVFRDPDGVWVARGAWSFRDTPLSSLLGEDGVPYVRDRVGSAIADGRAGTGPRRCALQFNRFEVTVDLDEETVLVQNVLDTTDAGEQRVSIAAFLAAVAERGASD